jgi:hypothetical protein
MSNQITVSPDQITITGADLAAIDQALDYASRALELQISELEKASLIDGVMQVGILATMARESITTYRAAIDTIESLSDTIYKARIS